MSKYSKELKLKIVEEYINSNIGYRILSKKYNIEASILKNWVSLYKENGIDGLEKPKKTSYSCDFKLEVLEYMYKNALSARQTASHFNIRSHASILKWNEMYKNGGIEALSSMKKGRPSMKNKSSKEKDIKLDSVNIEDTLKEIENLRKENRLLKIENEYLKKLKALAQIKE